MNFGLWQLFAIGFVYLSILFVVAYATEKEWIPTRAVHHPLTYVLSLGVFACSIAVFGAVHLSFHFGGGFLLYFAGASALFFLAPLLLAPLRRITERHKLSSLADVFAFRFPGPFTGGVVAIFMLLATLPLIALQIQAVAVTIHLLNQDLGEHLLAALFCGMITLFAALFGTRHISLREPNRGLVMAIAAESLIKLLALGAIAIYALATVLGGHLDISTWLAEGKPLLETGRQALSDGQSRDLLVIFFAAALALPHTFHMTFSETHDPSGSAVARWGFPLYLLLLSLAIPPILWSGLILEAPTEAEYYTIGIGLARQSTLVTILGFIAALSAGSGVLILTSSALSSMTLNHVILPLFRPSTSAIYSRLLAMRRLLIAVILIAGFALYTTLEVSQNLISLGLVSFTAVAQFLPGIGATLLWRRATSRGFLAGLTVGVAIWFVTLLLPLVINIFANLQIQGGAEIFDLTDTSWQFAIELSLGANLLVLIAVSLLTDSSIEEQEAAYNCMSEAAWGFQARELEAGSVHEIKQSLAMALGRSVSDREVDIAIAELRIDVDDQRPYALRKLRERMETSISGMLGQTVARNIIGSFLPYKKGTPYPMTETPHAIESRIEEYQVQLTGLAKELDGLRRYHRQTLQELPTAVCSISADGEILTWNHAMSELTGLPADSVIGLSRTVVGEPWRSLLSRFAKGGTTHLLKQHIEIGDRVLWLNLHKAVIEEAVSQRDNLVIVIDDITENQMLENKLLHSERLASIGQLAAGVAHEIGNPITGIACLTQNLKLETDNEEVREMSDQILDQTERISSILQSLVNFAHSGQNQVSERIPVRLRQIVEDAIQLLRLNPRNQDYLFDNRCAADLQALGDAQRLGQVLVNILTNARDASLPGDTIHIRSRRTDDRAIIEVIDQGHGIPPAYLEEVFEPFFTTKKSGEGTGLGLTIVSSIIEEHNGSIEVESPVQLMEDEGPIGTRITIALPLYNSVGKSRSTSSEGDAQLVAGALGAQPEGSS